MFRWGFPLFAAAMAVVVVAVADGAVESAMSSRPMRWVGDRSYGLYLWHWPVFLLLSASRLDVADSALSMALLDVARVAVAVALAAASFRWLETPIRRRRRILGWRAPVAVVSSLGLLALLLVTVVPRPPSKSDTSVVALPPPTETTSVVPASSTVPPVTAAVGEAPSSPTSVPGTPLEDVPTEPAPPLRVLVAGDSMAVDLSEALIERATAYPDELVAGAAAFGGCGLSADTDGRLHEFTNVDGDRELLDISGCVEQWSSIPRHVRDEAIDVVLVDIGPWDALDMHLADGRMVSVGDETGRQLIADAYAEFASQVEEAGGKVVWVTPADAHLGWGEFDDPVNDPARWDAVRQIIAGLDVMQVDLRGWLAAEGLEGPDGRPDGIHLAPGLNERFVCRDGCPDARDGQAGLSRSDRRRCSRSARPRRRRYGTRRTL